MERHLPNHFAAKLKKVVEEKEVKEKSCRLVVGLLRRLWVMDQNASQNPLGRGTVLRCMVIVRGENFMKCPINGFSFSCIFCL